MRPCGQAQGRLDHGLLASRVQPGGGLVEQEQRGVAQEGSRQRDSLPLAAGHAVPALAQHDPEVVRQRGRARRGLDLLARGVGPAQRDVLGERAGEEVGALRDPGDPSRQRP